MLFFVGVIVSRQGCIVMIFGIFGFCCELIIDIKVKNCGYFYVYYLKLIYFCLMVYCVGMYIYDSIFKKLKLKIQEILVFNVMLWYFKKKRLKFYLQCFIKIYIFVYVGEIYICNVGGFGGQCRGKCLIFCCCKNMQFNFKS